MKNKTIYIIVILLVIVIALIMINRRVSNEINQVVTASSSPVYPIHQPEDLKTTNSSPQHHQEAELGVASNLLDPSKEAPKRKLNQNSSPNPSASDSSPIIYEIPLDETNLLQ